MNRSANKATLPLAGKRVLVSRAQKQAGALSAGLRELGAEVIEIPFIEIRPPDSYRPLDDALARVRDYHWLILTSANGVSSMFSRMREQGRNASELRHLKIAAIGPATRNSIEKHGLTVDVMPDEYIAESVVACLKDQLPGKKVLLVRAKIARDVIPHELRAVGAEVDVIEAYQTVIPEASAVRLRTVLADPRQRPDVITFTSSSTVRHFATMLGHPQAAASAITGIQLASIGPVTSATLRELGLPVSVEASEFTIPGLIEAIAKASK